VQKIKSYETLTAGGGWIHADEYLPELVEFDAHAASRDGLDEFDGIFSKIRPNFASYDFSSDDLDKLEAAMTRKFELYWRIRGVDAARERENVANMRVGDRVIPAIPKPNR
jgi:hypothetical protein